MSFLGIPLNYYTKYDYIQKIASDFIVKNPFKNLYLDRLLNTTWSDRFSNTTVLFVFCQCHA